MSVLSLAKSNRGVSDVLAFIIVFSIIITSVALVYGTGFSSISQISEGEQKTNAVRAFEAIELSFRDVQKGDAPRRGGSVNLGGGRLQVESGPTVSVEVDGTEVYSNNTGSLEYFFENTQVAYENGAIFRSDRGNSVNIVRSSMTCRSGDKALVSVVVIRSESNPIGADGSVEYTLAERNSSIVYSNTDPGTSQTVSVTVSGSDYSDGWETSMDEAGWDTSGAPTYECGSVDQVVVRVTVIDVEYNTP